MSKSSEMEHIFKCLATIDINIHGTKTKHQTANKEQQQQRKHNVQQNAKLNNMYTQLCRVYTLCVFGYQQVSIWHGQDFKRRCTQHTCSKRRHTHTFIQKKREKERLNGWEMKQTQTLCNHS